jgi:hypothetical protein
MRAAFGRREVFQARLWECRQHWARRRVSVRSRDAAEIFPEGRKAVARAKASPAQVPRQDACQKAALPLVSVDRVPEDRWGVLEIFELFQAQPLDERCREQRRQGGAPQAPRAEQERPPEVSGAQAQLVSARPERRRVSRRREPQVRRRQAQ